MFSKPYRWLIIAKPNGYRNVPTELIHMKIFVDSEVIFAEKTIEVFNLNLGKISNKFKYSSRILLFSFSFHYCDTKFCKIKL